ncbi:MAG: N-acetyltransferase [Coriobacteriia bacterium]|nr:N-acetyltransferase [Coriobacteriia bacterium]
MSEAVIRSETPQDIDAIREINVAAFLIHPYSHQTEHLIVEALRADSALTISLVAVLDGGPVGHIAFSEAVIGESGQQGWFLLGPVAVFPGLQREGIGSALVSAGLDELRARGASGCVLVGDPEFYGRFGFRSYPGLTYEGVPSEYVLCLPFGGAAPVGAVRAHEAFEIETDLG